MSRSLVPLATLLALPTLIGIAGYLLQYANIPIWAFSLVICLLTLISIGPLVYSRFVAPTGAVENIIKTLYESNSLDNNLDTHTEKPVNHPLCRMGHGFHSLIKRVQGYHSDTMAFLRQLSAMTDRLAIGGAEISYFVDGLHTLIAEQSKRVEQIGVAAEEVATTTSTIADNAQQAAASATATRSSSTEGQKAIAHLMERVDLVNNRVASVADLLQALQQQSESIQGITEVINGVASQTNLLALNAAIEAARAGEYGRGFSVVADQVRELANKTTYATAEIETMLTQTQEQSEQVGLVMQQLQIDMQEIVQNVETTDQALQQINEHANTSDHQVQQIVMAMTEHVKASEEISAALQHLNQSLHQSETDAVTASDDAVKLAELAEDIVGNLSNYDLNTHNDKMRQAAQAAAADVARAFEEALEKGTINTADLFDREYQVIEGTNPTKYTTRLDSFTDRILPAIQEPLLEQYPQLLYAGAVDDNGYFPTHNKRYSQPLTGDYHTDVANSRTKRIFDDRTGLRCAKNTKPFLLQTYKRDTGEVLHDISVPIMVKGRHWGAFRMGYHAL